MTKTTPINISQLERDSECRLGEKISVHVPNVSGRLLSNDVSYPGANGDQYLDFDEVKGMSFTIPVCPCSMDGRITASITVRSPSDFNFFRDYVKRTAWLEQSACPQLAAPSSPPPNLAKPETPSSDPAPPKQGLHSEVGAMLGAVASNFGAQVMGDMVTFGVMRTATPSWVGEYFNDAMDEFSEPSGPIDEMIQQVFQDSLHSTSPAGSGETPSGSAEQEWEDDDEIWEEEI